MTITVRNLATADIRPTADIVVLQCHLHRDEPAYLNAVRDAGYQGLIVGWFWDNHHGEERNRVVAALVDVAIAAHDVHAAYLREHALLLPSVMLCSTQWSRRDATALWESLPPSANRTEGLYGGFARTASARSGRLERLIASGRYPGLWFTRAEGAPPYFELSSEERFRHWTRYGVSLCVPSRDDLSNRFFDAWLTGQVPVVTPDIPELARPWAEPHRDRDIVCAASYDEDDINAAYRCAWDIFVAGGIAGQRKRHQLALDHHLLEHRIARIVTLLRDSTVSSST